MSLSIRVRLNRVFPPFLMILVSFPEERNITAAFTNTNTHRTVTVSVCRSAKRTDLRIWPGRGTRPCCESCILWAACCPDRAHSSECPRSSFPQTYPDGCWAPRTWSTLRKTQGETALQILWMLHGSIIIPLAWFLNLTHYVLVRTEKWAHEPHLV